MTKCFYCNSKKAELMWMVFPCCRDCFDKLVFKEKLKNQKDNGGGK